MPSPLRCSLAALSITLLAPLSFAGVELTQDADKVTVKIDGKLFTEYHFTNCRRPYCYPVIGPTGGAMTRHWPLEDDLATEEKDHPHHKGLWYGHRVVDGADFWGESLNPKEPNSKIGKMIPDGSVEVKSGEDSGFLTAKYNWIIDGQTDLTCSDQRTVTFRKGADGPLIDYDVTITAPPNKEVVFGDDKDGTMSIRVPESMRVDKPKAKGEKTAQKGDGHIVTSEGKKDAEAWGTRGNWCDYWGPVEGKTAGVAIFDNPNNPRHPTWWHVRTYGLFSANPFGQAQFEKLPDKHAGNFKIEAGKSVTFRYRFYFHAGDTDEAKVADHYRDYTAKVK
jgi:hypothetical protein